MQLAHAGGQKMQRLIGRILPPTLLICLIMSTSIRLYAESIVLIAEDYPPYIFAVPEDGLRGFDVEVIDEAFKRVKISTEFKFSPWKRAIEETKLGLYAGIFNCSYRAEREKFLIYSSSISQQSPGFFIRSGFTGFKPTRLEDSKGLRVGSVLGWAMAATMKDAGAILVAYRTEELVFRDLLKGIIDYAYLSLESSGYGAMKLGISKKIDTIQIQEKKLHVCFSKKWPGIEEIVNKFNKGLAAIRKDGTHKRIHASYR